MTAAEFARYLTGVKLGEESSSAYCPAHEDREQSLSFRDKQDRILVKCHAGCSIDQIAKAVGLRVSDFFHDAARDDGSTKKPRRIVQTYDYVDEERTLLYQVVRYLPKTFRQRRPDGKGGWLWNLNGVRRVVYHLPDLTGHQTVYAPEGEKDVDLLWKLGLVATCNAGGAAKWSDELTDQLKAAGVERVLIFPDNDEGGQKHGQLVAQSCATAGLAVTIVHLPGLPPVQRKKGEDISDWFEQGHRVEELLAAVDTAPPFVLAPASAPQRADKPEPFHLTDFGNSERLVALNGQDIRHCAKLGWLTWDGTRWCQDDAAFIMQKAKQAVRRIYFEAGEADDEKIRRALAAHAKSSEADYRLHAMVRLAESEPGIPITHDQLDADPWLLNVLNGRLDLRTGALQPHRRDDLMTKLCPVIYDSDAKCPRWDAFLDRILVADMTLISFLQRAVGYSLTGVIREHALFVPYGTGANGKTTLVETIKHVLGDYAQHTRAETFLAKYWDSIPADLAALRGARFVCASEAESGRALAESLVKSLTGGDTVTARFMKKDFFSFRPTFKLWLATNHKPRIRGTDYAIWRRIKLIPFTLTIPDDEQDPTLGETLKSEAPGILRWCVKGCLAWQQEGLAEPSPVLQATALYRQEQDTLGVFFAERCVFAPNTWVGRKELFDEYKVWAESGGEKGILSKREFTLALKERGLEDRRMHEGRGWQGLRLLLIGEGEAEVHEGVHDVDNLD